MFQNYLRLPPRSASNVLGQLLLENGRLTNRAQPGAEKTTREQASAAAGRMVAAVEREQLRDEVNNEQLSTEVRSEEIERGSGGRRSEDRLMKSEKIHHCSNVIF